MLSNLRIHHYQLTFIPLLSVYFFSIYTTTILFFMTWYEEQIIKINNSIGKDYLYRHVMLAKKFIDIHFAEEISLDEMAGKAFFSKFHFIRLFKTIYNKTPHQYLTTVRIDKAKQLLRAGKSVEEVCFSVGFASIGSFKVLFKRHTKRTPVFYKQNTSKKQATLQTPLPLYCFLQKSNFQDGE